MSLVSLRGIKNLELRIKNAYRVRILSLSLLVGYFHARCTSTIR